MIFRKHRPYVIHAVVFVIITEVVHMILIPLTHLGDLETANMLMMEIFLPILVSNILIAATAVLCTSLMEIKFSGHRIRDVVKEKDILFSQDLFYSFQFWLLLVIIVAFAANILIISRLYGVMSLESSSNKYESELKIMKSLIYQDYGYFHNFNPDQIACVYAEQWSDEKVVAFEVADKDNNIISNNAKFPDLGMYIEGHRELDLFRVRIDDETLYVMYINIDQAKMISYSYEKYEMYLPYFTSSMTIFIQIIIFGLLMFAVFVLLKLLVGNNLNKINKSLHEITRGNLDEHVDVYSHKEFATLSDSINATVDTLKQYIEEEANRYKEEFEMAKQIQLSALPNVFPPFPNDPEIDLYAKYKPAKIVGGDFYDYYYIGKNRLAFLIADVSGKGVPAAMFMMRAKTAFRVFADKKDNPADVLEAVNNYLCENNEAEMFVTAWFGMVDITTGKIMCASAGHNPPFLINTKSGEVKCLNYKPSLVLGAMNNIGYNNYIFEMKPDEKLMLYTDGIVEAHDVNNKLYGEERFKKSLEKHKDLSIRDLCENAAFEVDEYSKGQEQFDDYSLLCFTYKGEQEGSGLKNDYWESEITVFSKIESVNKVMERCEETLKYSNAPANFVQMFDVCIDEIFSNIVKFSYDRPNEYISVRIVIDETSEKKCVTVTFVDTGPRFNPLEQSAPDITLSAEEREIGGLGIFMVRQMMDDLRYEYKSLAN
ncbi:MAG: SpoIIE family protein phosphatase, partial [Coriobacteriia bacterium]|nr:SpoIIE family protein phosphatase [Coriobacteriia bacterium]